MTTISTLTCLLETAGRKELFGFSGELVSVIPERAQAVLCQNAGQAFSRPGATLVFLSIIKTKQKVMIGQWDQNRLFYGRETHLKGKKTKEMMQN